MSTREVRRRFDEIVAFAEVEKFLHTPVKRYSSGMAVRLAFAVAAHLDAELLLIDEVLTVGDAAFQRKCVEKVASVCRAGRSALIVSHQLDRITAVCDRALRLQEGRLVDDGPADEVVGRYVRAGGEVSGVARWEAGDAPGDDDVRLMSVEVRQPDRGPDPTGTIDRTLPTEFTITYEVLRAGFEAVPAFWLADTTGTPAFASAATPRFAVVEGSGLGGPGRVVARCVVPAETLNERRYSLTPIINEHPFQVRVIVRDAVGFQVIDSATADDGFSGEWYGVVRPRLAWRVGREP